MKFKALNPGQTFKDDVGSLFQKLDETSAKALQTDEHVVKDQVWNFKPAEDVEKQP